MRVDSESQATFQKTCDHSGCQPRKCLFISTSIILDSWMPVTETQLETSLSFRGNSKISLPSALPLDSQALGMILHLNWPWTFCICTPDIALIFFSFHKEGIPFHNWIYCSLEMLPLDKRYTIYLFILFVNMWQNLSNTMTSLKMGNCQLITQWNFMSKHMSLVKLILKNVADFVLTNISYCNLSAQLTFCHITMIKSYPYG